jgi:hypothetical protein
MKVRTRGAGLQLCCTQCSRMSLALPIHGNTLGRIPPTRTSVLLNGSASRNYLHLMLTVEFKITSYIQCKDFFWAESLKMKLSGAALPFAVLAALSVQAASFHIAGGLTDIATDVLRAEGAGVLARGVSASTMLTIGVSVGSFTLGLAGREIAAQVISGIALKATNRFNVGDMIVVEDQKQGHRRTIVESMDWLSTDLRCSDEIITKVPNAKLVEESISNISRVTKSQVTETIYLSYNDINKIPTLVQNIKNEIEKTCGDALVTDGSRPFRVILSRLGEGFIEVKVDARFRISPVADDYFYNKQEVLMAISRAVTESGAAFYTFPLS